ncbi:MAG: hypothetical protein F4138_04225 [Acidimicrobiia bacterium]|nr:hypothetical protein [Acidimicrobiia bacterium]MYC58426.1 hypothetical protein [Acidimicrobiia bacterium]MYG94185.1 hypothetical protein [Acidimicrobiia bacterium]MYI30468.1 hypothetical protein [Acidimicrobiia bacterium]
MSIFVAFFVFLLIMLALATLGIILDWMGKPIRRSFRPRTAGTPGWLTTNQTSSSSSPKISLIKTALTSTKPATPQPWQAGESIFKPTPKGTPPSMAAIRRRYWKNLSEQPSAVMFGERNQARMAIGQAPQRFNPRTNSLEEMQLPEEMLRYCRITKHRPTPTWGDQGLNPYAQP